MSRRASLAAPLAVIAAAVLAAAGCTSSGSTGPSRTNTGGTNTGGTDTAPGGAQDPRAQATTVLKDAGLALPAEASDVRVTRLPDTEVTDRYLVTFTAAPAAVVTMCRDAGINGPWPATTLTAEERSAYGVDTAPAGARVCEGSRPTDYARQLRVLYSGDPASVRVAVFRMPAR